MDDTISVFNAELQKNVEYLLMLANADGTFEGIRTFFEERHIQGEPTHAHCCLIANYLMAEGVDGPEVLPSRYMRGEVRVTVWDSLVGDWITLQCAIPGPLNEFAIMFDEHVFPALVEPEARTAGDRHAVSSGV